MDKKPRAKKHELQPDAHALGEAVRALVKGYGRGGLTHVANKLGMTPSHARKRLRSKTGGFDVITMRATLLIARSKAEDFTQYPIVRTERIGQFQIEIRDVNGIETPTWKAR